MIQKIENLDCNKIADTGELVMASPCFSSILPFYSPSKQCSLKSAKNKSCDLYIRTGIHAPLTSCHLPRPQHQKQFMETSLNKH